MGSRNVSGSDSISRFLGLGALVVAMGTGFYLHQQNQQLKTELAAQGTAPSDPQAYQEFVKTWDDKLSNALTEFDKQANAATKEFDAAREARNRIFQAGTEQSAGLTQTEVEDLIKNQIAEIQLPEPQPELRLATTVMRPSDDGELPMASIRNTGSVAAEITAARFKPMKGSEFVVRSAPKAAGDDALVIEFGPDHNQAATIEGAHRFYERTYIVPQEVVLENKTVKVIIEIRANNRHLDWGMLGDLELEYQDGQTVLIPHACAVFVPDPAETT